MALLEQLNWRYATKKFDHTKKLTEHQLNYLLSALQSAPSSMGLQPYRVLVIEDAAIREQLRAAAYGQQQITQASQLIVFAAETNMNEDFGRKYIDLIAQTRKVGREQLAGFEQAVIGAINSKNEADRIVWNQKQAYIALGVLVSAAAEQSIDICPMEGFEPGKFNEILGLTAKGLTATVIAAIGYRAADDAFSTLTKVRRPKAELFIRI